MRVFAVAVLALAKAAARLDFVSHPMGTQPFKAYTEDVKGVVGMFRDVFPYLEWTHWLLLVNSSDSWVFCLKRDSTVVGTVFLRQRKVQVPDGAGSASFSFSMTGFKSVDVIEVYCLYLREDLRGKGISYSFLMRAIQSVMRERSIKRRCFIALCISALDKYMYKNFAVYIRFGFRWANVSTGKLFNDVLRDVGVIKSLPHPIVIAKKIIRKEVRPVSALVTFYTTYKDFRLGEKRFDKKLLSYVGVALQRVLRNR